jgi:hypothetical protein
MRSAARPDERLGDVPVPQSRRLHCRRRIGLQVQFRRKDYRTTGTGSRSSIATGSRSVVPRSVRRGSYDWRSPRGARATRRFLDRDGARNRAVDQALSRTADASTSKPFVRHDSVAIRMGQTMTAIIRIMASAFSSSRGSARLSAAAPRPDPLPARPGNTRHRLPIRPP